MPESVAFGARSSVTGFAASVPRVNLVQSSEAPLQMARVPSESVVAKSVWLETASVPEPTFSNAPEIGAAIVADAPLTTVTVGTVSVPPPSAIVVSAINITEFAAASAASVAEALAVEKIALLPSTHPFHY